MRFCGIDVSAKPGNQQLVTLHERRTGGGTLELVAFADFLVESTQALREEWEARREALRASGELPS